MAELDANLSIDATIASSQAEVTQAQMQSKQTVLIQGSNASGGDQAFGGTLDGLMKAYPEFYKLLTESLAQNMINKAKRDSDRYIEQMKERRARDGG